MSGNSFATGEGSHVTGAVAMAVNDHGVAVPIEADTPIGLVKIDASVLDGLAHLLAAHVSLMTGKPLAETTAALLAAAKGKTTA